MRKQLFILIIFIFTSISTFSQYHIEKTETDTFYILEKIDTLNYPNNLPDGKYKYLYLENDKNMISEFFIHNNKINGEFKYWLNGALVASGYYLNDSLWTFYCPKGFHYDTTFMVGIWFFYDFPQGWKKVKFKIPFKEKDIFTQIMTDEKGNIHTKYVWDKTLGLIEETWYNDLQKASEYIKTENYSIKTEWNNENKIQSIEIIQDSLKYENNLIRSERFYNNVGFSIESLKESPDKYTKIPVIEIRNEGKDIKYVKINDSSFNFLYLKKNGKWKSIRIK